MSDTLLRISDLSLGFEIGGRSSLPRMAWSFDVRRGSCVGLVGESGSGKSLTSLAIMRLLSPQARVLGGRILFDGQDLLALAEDRHCAAFAAERSP